MREEEEDIMRGWVRDSVKAWRGQCKKVEEGQYDRVGGGKGGGGEKVEGGWRKGGRGPV